MKKKITKDQISMMQASVSKRLVDGGMPVHEAVSALRRALDLSQDQFADTVNLAKGKISVIERDAGNPSLSTLRRIAGEFGLEIGFVKTASDPRNPFEVYAAARKDAQHLERA